MKLKEIKHCKKFEFSCIYLWTNLVNNKKYVGQTQDMGMRFSKYKSGDFNPYMKKAINKYGVDNFEITILERDVELSRLDEREQFWMDYYQSYNKEFGYNLVPIAGCGARGRIVTEETRKKLSEIAKKRFESEPGTFTGKKHTEEYKEKMRKIAKNRGRFMKMVKVDCYSLEGTFLRTYDCIVDATRDTGASSIKECLGGRQKTSGGYLWVKHGESFNIDNFIKRKDLMKRISCYDLDDNYICTYNSIKEAAGGINNDYQAICRCLNGRAKQAIGFKWKYCDN